jgi:hypothetical protein
VAYLNIGFIGCDRYYPHQLEILEVFMQSYSSSGIGDLAR